MFEIAWSKLMLIGVVALIVIGPKDLPAVLRTLGEAIGKLRRMADEFRGQFNDAMKEAELDGLKKDFTDLGDSVRNATSTDFNPINTIREEIKGAVEAKQSSATPAPTPLSDAESRALEIKMAEERLAQLKAEQELASLPLPEPPPPLDITSVPAPVATAPVAPAPSAPAPPATPKAAEKGAA